MTRAEWAQLEARFLELADASPQAQREALAAERARNPQRAAELARLLSADLGTATPLDTPLAALAAALLAHDDDVPATRFGPYRLVRPIGEGGMGIVYLAHRDDLDSSVAIKVLRDAWLSPARRDRFREEQRTLASLEHAGIARLLDADVLADGTPWFAMEFVDGVPITTWCWTRGLALRDRLALVIDVLEAVRHAHERAVIHRDLKPSNLLVTPDGAVKLLDFGIAKRTTGGAVVDATRTGLRLLTPAYAAPEQLAGETVGVQADVYALGVMLFELIAGARPYDVAELSTAEAVRRLRSEPPPRVSLAVRRAAGDAKARSIAPDELASAAWADLDALVAGALDADLARRYRSADALLRDLQRFLDSEPLEMRPASVGHRLGLLLRRRRPEVILASVAALLLTLGAVSYTRGITAARDAAEAQTARTERLQEFMVGLFSGGDEDAGPADTLRVSTLIDNGVREARLLSSEPELQLDMLQSLGTIAQQLGRYDLADSLFREAVRGRVSKHGATHEETLHARLLATGLLVYRNDYDAARDSFLAVLAASREVLPPDHRVVHEAMQGLGGVLSELGEPDSAVVLLDAAVRRFAPEDRTSTAYGDLITLLANAHFYAGRRSTSDSLNRLALDITRSQLGDAHPSLAYNYVNLGQSALEEGRIDDADAHFSRAVELNARWHGMEHPRNAPVLRMLAQVRSQQGRSEDALSMLQLAARTFETRFDTLSPSLANLYATMAQVHAALGDTVAPRVLHTKAREIARVALGTNHPHFRMHTGNLAAELTVRGEFDDAAALLVPLVAEAQAELPANDINLAFWTLRLGRVRAGQGRWREADSVYALGLAAMRASGYADTATIAKLTGEHAAVRDSLRIRGGNGR